MLLGAACIVAVQPTLPSPWLLNICILALITRLAPPPPPLACLQDCDKVPVTTTVQRCGKVCKPVVVQPVVVQPVVAATAVATTEVAVPFGKGKGKLMGKGRHLMTIGKGKFLGKGKGMVAPVSIDCDTVCQNVPITTFRTQCETMTRTVTSCRKDFEQVRGMGGPRLAGD